MKTAIFLHPEDYDRIEVGGSEGAPRILVQGADGLGTDGVTILLSAAKLRELHQQIEAFLCAAPIAPK